MQKHESFRPRPPSAQKYDLGYSRMFDNHFNPRVHQKPWLAHAKTPQQAYYSEDSGLGLVETKMKKLSFLKSKHEKIKEIREKYNSFRNFDEYETILTNEILITIEYCTNCMEHSGTTRHSEEKYSLFASELKRKIISQYPVIKVLMKPLIFDHHSQSPECIYLRTRLGALEVQLVTKDSKGLLSKEIIFSKLTTRVWPSVPLVIDSIASFLPKDDVMVRLIDPNFDPNQFYQKQQGPSQPGNKPLNRLKGIHVILRPFKQSPNSFFEELNDSKRMNESFQYNTSTLNQTMMHRPSDARVRPRSAMSNASGKTHNTSFNGPYGRDGLNTTTMSPPTKRRTTIGKPQVEFKGVTDDYGVVLLKKIPHNIYEIEVIENTNFLPEKRIINCFEMVEQCLPLREDIELRTQTMCFCKVKVHEKKSPISEATIVIGKKNPLDDSKTAILKEKTPGSGFFEFLIDPGEYLLSITRYGFMERIEEIVATQGENNFEIELQRGEIPTLENIEPQKPAIDAKKSEPYQPRPPSGKHRYAEINRDPMNNDIPKPKPSRTEDYEINPMEKKIMPSPNNYHEIDVHPDEVTKGGRPKSKQVKKVTVRVVNLDTEEPIFGAEFQIDEIGLKGTTDHEGKIQVPISKLKEGRIEINHQDFFGIIEDYGDDGGLDLNSLPNKVFSLIPRTSNDYEIHVRFIPGNKKRCLKLHIMAEENLGDDGRVFAGNEGKQVLILRKLHSKNISIGFNMLEKRGVIRIIGQIEDMQEFLSSGESFLLVSIRDECEPLPINLPYYYQNMRGGVIWDIGFFANTAKNLQFYELNAFTTQKLSPTTYLHEYQIILNYLHNSKSDLKTILGFKSKNRVERNGDIFIKRETIEASLEKYGLEIEKPAHLFASALKEDGLYSYLELERRFSLLQPPFSFVESKQSSLEANDGEYLYGGSKQNGK